MFGLQDILSVASGSLVGFTLGLVGGGGSILAMPLMIYVVGVSSTHAAIGTSAVAVAASAAANLIGHGRARTIKWPCAAVFAISGVIGAAGGAELGKLVDGHRLLLLFGALMVVVGLLVLPFDLTIYIPNLSTAPLPPDTAGWCSGSLSSLPPLIIWTGRCWLRWLQYCARTFTFRAQSTAGFWERSRCCTRRARRLREWRSTASD